MVIMMMTMIMIMMLIMMVTILMTRMPVDAVSKSMAMRFSPFINMFPDQRSQWQKPILPRLLDRGLMQKYQNCSLILIIITLTKGNI